MVKRLIIIRHAHRDKPPFSDENQDNGLSEKGERQAKSLAKYWEKELGDRKAILYSSPKKRCIETIERISELIDVKIKILDSLNESDTHKELHARVSQFIDHVKKSDETLVVAASHGDWIPAFTEQFLGATIDLDKGGWIEIEEGQLRSVIQKFR